MSNVSQKAKLRSLDAAFVDTAGTTTSVLREREMRSRKMRKKTVTVKMTVMMVRGEHDCSKFHCEGVSGASYGWVWFPFANTPVSAWQAF